MPLEVGDIEAVVAALEAIARAVEPTPYAGYEISIEDDDIVVTVELD